MTLKEAYEKRRQEVLSLQRQLKKLEKELEKVTSGLFPPSEKADLLKQINSLSQNLKKPKKTGITTANYGTGNEIETCTMISARWIWRTKTKR